MAELRPICYRGIGPMQSRAAADGSETVRVGVVQSVPSMSPALRLAHGLERDGHPCGQRRRGEM